MPSAGAGCSAHFRFVLRWAELARLGETAGGEWAGIVAHISPVGEGSQSDAPVTRETWAVRAGGREISSFLLFLAKATKNTYF